jgi:hypothetical protein
VFVTLQDPVQSKHQSPASRDSTTSMPPRSPSGRFLPAGSPLPEEPSRTFGGEMALGGAHVWPACACPWAGDDPNSIIPRFT